MHDCIIDCSLQNLSEMKTINLKLGRIIYQLHPIAEMLAALTAAVFRLKQ
jgi:hypothetical protein